MINWLLTKQKRIIILGIFAVFVAVLLFMAFKPYHLNQEVALNPATTYGEALARIDAITDTEAEHPDLNPECGTILMTHGTKVDNLVVFFHGFTSCPIQFTELGEAYFDQGYNVYIPRQPKHGLKDVKGTALKGLSAEALAAFATEAIDIAQGLGEEITVVGLSSGGAIATWAAQERDDIDLAVALAPFLGVNYIPKVLTRPITNLVLSIPDIFLWWDGSKKMDNELIAPYSYRGYYLHALFENLRLGFITEEQSKKEKPAASAILVVTNANDPAVNNDVVASFEQLWLTHGEEFLTTYQFEKELFLPHDFITFTHPEGQPELVYPKLIEIIQSAKN
jgi:carboxylesterase